MFRVQVIASIFAISLIATARSAVAGVVTTHAVTNINAAATVDGSVSSGEYQGYTYAGGMDGMSNFGGTLGNGTLYFESNAANLYIGANIAGNLGGNI